MIKDYVCVDLETSGIRAKWDRIIEIGAVKVRDGKVVDTFSQLINPGIMISDRITDLTGITNEMLEGKPMIEDVLPEFIRFVGDDLLLGHNIMFDYNFLKQNAINLKLEFEKEGIDTLKIARKTLKGLESRGLEYLCKYYGIKDENHHRAYNDANVTSQLYLILMKQFGEEFPECFKTQPLKSQAKKMSPITEKQKAYLGNLMKWHRIVPDFDINQLTKNEASRKIDKILSEKGRIFD